MKIIIIIIVAIPFCFLIFIYNNLIGKKNTVEKSLKNIDTLLMKRYDLMTNLILQAERSMDHEESVHLRLGEIRKEINHVKDNSKDISALDTNLQSIASKMNLIVEQYPQLRAIESVNIGMQANISLENEIAAGRIHYNDNIELYKNAVEMFPANLIAPIFGFTAEKYKYIEADTSKKEPVIPIYSDKIKDKYK